MSTTFENEFFDKILSEKNRFGFSTQVFDHEDVDCRTIRVFISSTFKDFYNEREVLVKKVFPRLRDFCVKRGLFLVECDLRWGVPKDATSVEAIAICLDEIERSIEELKGRNFFLGLVGDRFGWSPTPDQLSSQIVVKYNWIEGASVTLMEMLHGVVRTMSQNCLILNRDGENLLPELPHNHVKVFAETDPEIQEKVSTVKSALTQLLGQSNQFQGYTCKFAGIVEDPVTKKERVQLTELDEFEEKVCKFFEESIEKTFHTISALDKAGSASLDEEQKLLLNALQHSAMESVVLPQDLVQVVDDPENSLMTSMEEKDENDETIVLDGKAMLCLVGEAGSGKSTLMAALVKHLQRSIGKEDKVSRLFYHFCGASVASKFEHNLIRRLQSALMTNNGKEDNERQFIDVVNEFSNYHSPNLCFILIDGLDEMTSNYRWLPEQPLPSNVTFILSCLQGPTFYQLPSSVLTTMNVPPLSQFQSESYIKSYFHEFGKSLNEEDFGNLLRHESAANPLWLSLACEEIRLHGDYSTLSSVIQLLSDSIFDLYTKILNRIIEQDSTDLTLTFLRLLFISRAGLWENEVTSLLIYFTGRENIPLATVTEIFRALKPFTHRVGVPVPVLKLRHRIVADVLEKALFGNEDSVEVDKDEEVKHLHSKMADFFRNALTDNEEGNLTVYQHLETVYHRYRAGERVAVMNELWCLFSLL